MDLYADNILDHYRSPRAKQALADATAVRHETNASCGDALALSLTLKHGRITALGWDGQGCAISQAGMSILGETLVGKTTTEAAALTSQEMLALLGVPIGPRRLKCGLLALHTLKNTLRAAEGKEPQGWTETLATTD